MKIQLFFFAFFLLFSGKALSQKIDFTPKDKQIFDNYIDYIQPFAKESRECVLRKTVLFFLGTPYVASTLEKNQAETLIINLREMDCVTYVENVIALSRIVLSGSSSIDDFASQLLNIRYRNGVINGYESRLHYTSDWAYDNQNKGVLEQITSSLGGILEKKTIDFMSSHRNLYVQLKSDDAMLRKIKSTENEINKRGGFYYLPKEMIKSKATQIPSMTIVAFTTSIKGLDTSHLGFTYYENGQLGFIHASSAKGKVVVDEKTLSAYCASRKTCTGVMLLKVL